MIGKTDKKAAEKKAKEAAAEDAKVKPSKAISTYFFYSNNTIPKDEAQIKNLVDWILSL